MSRVVGFIMGLVALLVLPVVAFAQETLPPAPEVPPEPVSSSIPDGMLTMSDEAIIMGFAGIIMSILFSVLSKRTWDSDIKAALFVAACLGFGALYTVTVDDGWRTADFGRRILLILGAGTIFYQMFKSPMQTFSSRTDKMLGRTGSAE